MTDFSRRVVLVTGGSRGIGRACAKLFAEQGARVAINYRKNRTAAEETRASLPGGSHTIVQADVARADEAVKMVDTVRQETGRIDILVNSAGSHVSLRIFDILGREVRELQNGKQDAGGFQVRWDGKNDEGSGYQAACIFYVFRQASLEKPLRR